MTREHPDAPEGALVIHVHGETYTHTNDKTYPRIRANLPLGYRKLPKKGRYERPDEHHLFLLP